MLILTLSTIGIILLVWLSVYLHGNKKEDIVMASVFTVLLSIVIWFGCIHILE